MYNVFHIKNNVYTIVKGDAVAPIDTVSGTVSSLLKEK